MPPIPLLPPHHDPHSAPLCLINGLYYFGRLVDKSDSSCDMVERLDISDLLPGHRHVLQQFEDGVGNIFESAEVDSLVLAEALRGHISMVLYYFSIQQIKKVV